MMIVTGATGQYGSKVVEGLLERLPASQIGVSVRDPEKAAHLAARGVRVARGDFADPQSLQAAFDGAEQVLIVSVDRLGEEAKRQHGNAIQAAKDAGAKRILYTSHQAANPASAFAPGRDHAETEQMMRESGLDFVSLRNGFYAQSALYQLAGVPHTGELAVPTDGPASWTDRGDLAAAGVAALTQPDLFDGISPPLTAAETLDFEAMARFAAEALGRPIPRRVISDEEFVAARVAQGVPQPMAEMLLGMFIAARNGEFNVVDPTLEKILGRRPRALKDVVAEAMKGA